jgi:hypothetical protein
MLRAIPTRRGASGIRPDLDEKRARSYSLGMINASTILIARRRRAIAVWAVVCV